MKKVIAILLIFCLAFPYTTFAQHSISILDEEESIYRWSKDLLRLYAQYAMVNSTFLNPPPIGLLASVNDPYYDSSGSWGQSYDDMWGLKRINMENAWKLSTGEGVTVAVLDSGIDYNHVDINDNIWLNDAELNGLPGVDDDDNGYVDDIRGWDFHYQDNNPMDWHGHGTHVAGIIGAEGNNNEGIIGVAYESKVMPVKIISNVDIAYASRIAAGIKYAVNMGIKILNCSFGWPSYSSVLIDAFQYAYEKGCIVIAASGNNYSTIDGYPAKLNYAVTVGSTKETDARSSFSSYGSQLDVVAPGEDILSLRAAGTDMYEVYSGYSPGDYFVPQGDPNAKYYRSWGTSMAAPYVSGLAALMLSQSPALTYDDFVRRLKFSSVDLGAAGWDQYYGWGRIDAFEALSHDWYDSGIIRTWWMTDPDEFNVIRYDYYESGNTMSKWLDSPDQDNVIRYDYFDTGELQSKWLDTPDLYNVIRYSFFISSHLDSKWLHSPDLDGNTRYSFYDEDFDNNVGRSYIVESSDGNLDYGYGFEYGTVTDLIKYQSDLSSTLGGGKFFLYYDNDLANAASTRVVFDNGDIAEANILSEDERQITKFYNATTGDTAWFLWREDVYEGYDNVVIENASSPQKETISIGNAPCYIVISSDGNYAYVANQYNRSVSVIDIATNNIVKTISVGTWPSEIAITPNGSHAYIVNRGSNTISVINTSTNSLEKTISVGDFPFGIAITPDGNYAYVANLHSYNVTVIKTSTNSVIKTIPIGNNGWTRDIAITPSGNYAYAVNGGSDTVSIIDISTNTIIKTLIVGDFPQQITIAPVGNRAYVTNKDSNTVSVINTSTNSVVKTVAVGNSPVFVAVTPDGNYAYVANQDSNTVSVINTSTNSVVDTINAGSLPVHIAFTPNGDHVYIANKDSDNITKTNLYRVSWKAYLFVPDTQNPENVINPDNWTFIEEISDPESIKHLLPELGDWWDWVIENNVVPEFPPLSSDYTYDAGRVTQRVDQNPQTETTYDYEWDYPQAGLMKVDMSYDYDDDGNIDLIYTRVYNNGSDYDIANMDTWQLLSESYVYYESGIIKKTISPLGVVFEFYDNGNIKSTFWPKMGFSEFEEEIFADYGRGRITREIAFDGFAILRLSYHEGTDVPEVSEIYDRNGNLLRTQWLYSDLRLQKIEDMDGSVIEYSQDPHLITRRVTPDGFKYTYDATGRVTSAECPDGLYCEDLLDDPLYPGKIVRKIYSNAGKTVLLKTEIYSYEDLGNSDTWTLDETIMPANYTSGNDEHNRLSWEEVADSYRIDYEYYDLTPIVQQKTYTDLTTSDTIVYEYDPLSRLKKETIGNIEVTFRYYRGADNVRRVVVRDTDLDTGLYTLEYRQSGTLKKKTEGDMVSTYDVLGRIKSWKFEGLSETFVSYVSDSNNNFVKKVYTDLVTGNTIIYDYHNDSDNNLKKVIDLSGWYAEYDSDGRLVMEYNTSLETILYTYYGDSFNIATKRVIGANNWPATLYTYGENGVFLGQTIITIPTYIYDDLGRVIRVEYVDTAISEYTFHGATDVWATKTYTDREGNVYFKEYDADENLIKETNPDDTWTEYTYNGTGQLIRKDFQDGSYEEITYFALGGIQTIVKVNAFNRATTETYDETTGLKTQSETWDGKVTTYEYDGDNRLAKQNNPNGAYETFTYHGDTDIVDTHTYRSGSYWIKREYRTDGQLAKISTYYGYTTTYSYDDLNRLIEINYSYGSKTTYEYDGNTGNITKESYYYKENLTSWTDYEYYGDSGKIKSKTYNSTYGYWYKYEYDIKNGQLIKTTNSYDGYTCYEYDSLNRLARTDSSYGYTTIYTYHGNSDIYRTITYIDDEGRSYISEYDMLGKLISRSGWWYGEGEITYEYDSFGRTTRIDYASGEHMIYAYVGDYNYIQSVVYYDENNSELWSYSYTYYSSWRTQTYIYTRDGRTTTYNYLSDGRLLTIVTDEGTTAYNYDSRKRLESIVYPDDSRIDYAYEGTSSRRIRATRYNSAGEITLDEEWTYYSGTSRRKTYKKTDETGSVTLYEYNYSGRLERMTTNPGAQDELIAVYIYDGSERLIRINYSNNDYETKSYVGSTWRLDTLTRYYAGDNTTYTEKYTYYNDSYRIVTKTIAYRDGTTYSESYTYYEDGYTVETKTVVEPNGDTTVYHYDEEGVLLSEELPDGRTAYYSAYDENGRVTRKDFSDGKYQILSDYWNYSQAGYIREYNANGELLITYEYDKTGELLSTRYEYTINQLTDDSDNAYFAKIGDNGYVVWEKGPIGAKEIFLYDGSSIIQLTNNSVEDSLPEINNKGEVVWQCFGRLNGGIFFYDGSSTVQLSSDGYGPMINDNGDVVWSRNQDIFLYDGSATTQITNDPYENFNFQMNNNGYVVWETAGDGNDNWEIFLYNGSTTIQLTDNPYRDGFPDINDNGHVVWFGNTEDDQEIFLYDGATVSQLTDNSFDEHYAKINNDGHVVWQGKDGDDFEVFLYDGSGIIKLTDNAYDDKYPYINDSGYVIWQGHDGNDYEIFLYDGYSTRQLTDNDYDDTRPRINAEGQVVWTGNEEIFIAGPAYLNYLTSGHEISYENLTTIPGDPDAADIIGINSNITLPGSEIVSGVTSSGTLAGTADYQKGTI